MRGAQQIDGLIAAVVQVAGGRIVGRVRLQKVFYLLERLGLNGGIDFEYHHYGPYSATLAEALEDAKAFHLVEEDIERRVYDGVPYSVYKKINDLQLSDRVGGLELEDVRRALGRMQEESDATVLELAATIDWLQTKEQVLDWEKELRIRKAGKATVQRIERARALLADLNLAS